MAASYSSNGAKADTSRNKELAGQTVYKNGYETVYDADGYVKYSKKADDPTYRGTTDKTKVENGYTTDQHMDTDKASMSQADLDAIAAIRAQGASGAISWAEANKQANAIRDKYGYGISQEGQVYNPEGLQNSLNSAASNGATKYYDKESNSYKDMSSLQPVTTPSVSGANGATQKPVQQPTVNQTVQQPTVQQPTVNQTAQKPAAPTAPTIAPLSGVKEGSATRLDHVSGVGQQFQTLTPGTTFAPVQQADPSKLQQVQLAGPQQQLVGADTSKLQQVQLAGPQQQLAGADLSKLQQVQQATAAPTLQGADTSKLQQVQQLTNSDLHSFSNVSADSIGKMDHLQQGAGGTQLQHVSAGEKMETLDGSALNKADKVNVKDSVMGKYLDEWLGAAQKQQTSAIDHATGKAVNELDRAEQDAAAEFQTQRNQIAVDEAKSKDNQALYNEVRGDKGGIGSAQYDTIMANAAQNRVAVNSAQTKLASDTARQIADLRAQGEYEKADAMLGITQQYLSQLMQLEQWAAEYNMTADQFNAQLEQWLANYNMQVNQFNTQNQQWAIGQNLQVDRYNNELQQWLTDKNLQIDQHNADLEKWAADYNQKAEKYTADQLQWMSDFNADAIQQNNNLETWAQDFNQKTQQQNILNQQWQDSFNADAVQQNNALQQWQQDFNQKTQQQNILNQQWADKFNADAIQQNNNLETWAQDFNQKTQQQNILNQQWADKFNADAIQQNNNLETWAQDHNLDAAQLEAELKKWELGYNQNAQELNNAMAKWEAETNLGVDKFNASQEQWEKELNLGVAEQNAALQKWAAEHALDQQRYADSQAQQQQNNLAGAGESLLNAGIMPSNEQLTAMGLTQAQAQQYIQTAQALAAAKGSGSSSGNKTTAYDPKLTYSQVMDAIENGNVTAQVKQDYEHYMGETYADWNEHGNTKYTTLDFSPDEGTFFWNGKSYGDVNALLADVNAAKLSPEEENLLKQKLIKYGANVYSV